MNILIKKFLLFLLILLAFQAGAQKLSLYTEDDYPLQFMDDSRRITGFTVDVVNEIQRRLGSNDLIQMVPWSRGLNKLDNEKNTLLFSMAKTPERESKYQWIGPVSTVTFGLYVKKDSPLKITHFEDAKKVGLIGVYRNDVLDLTLTHAGFQNLDRADSNVSSFKKLMIGRIAVYADAPIGVQKVAEMAGYTLADVRLAYECNKTTLYIAVSKDTDPQLVAKWNKALDDMKKDKSFLSIQKKYNVSLDSQLN